MSDITVTKNAKKKSEKAFTTRSDGMTVVNVKVALQRQQKDGLFKTLKKVYANTQ